MWSKERIREIIRQIKASYWFIPTALALGALFLSQGLLTLDGWLGTQWLGPWSFLHASKPEGARAILSTIAGSMIGVAGVTFSITIAAVAYASAQFGPRIIDNFMQDRGNQITLGTFISTYLFCLLVLRAVTVGDNGEGFVPHVSLLVAVVLAVASLGVLIFFIHHTPESIHVSRVVSDIGKQLLRQVDSLFPEEIGEAAKSPKAENPPLGTPSLILRAAIPGYVQSIEGDKLLSLLSPDNALMKLEIQPGDFVAESMIIGKVYGPDNIDLKQLQACFVVGDERSPAQDIRYLIDQLVDIAGRALSPGVNDPFTAMSCVDWLGALITKVGRRDIQGRHRVDHDGRITLILPRPDFEELVNSYWDKLRPYVEKDRNAAFHMLENACSVMNALPPEEAVHVHRAAQRLVEGCLTNLTHPREVEQLEELRKSLRDANTTQEWARKASAPYRSED